VFAVRPRTYGCSGFLYGHIGRLYPTVFILECCHRNSQFSASFINFSRESILPNGSSNDVRERHVQPRPSNRLRIYVRDVFRVNSIGLMKFCNGNLHVKYILQNSLYVLHYEGNHPFNPFRNVVSCSDVLIEGSETSHFRLTMIFIFSSNRTPLFNFHIIKK
jgi:hypothetical protein